MRATALLLFSLVLISTASSAEPDVLLQAVSFAVTGSDASKVVAVNRQQCIFKINDDTYYFNNMYTDRIKLQNLKNNPMFKEANYWTEVDVHGKSKVVDIYSAPMQDRGTDMDRIIKAENPKMYQPHINSYADYRIRVETRESDRLMKAWQYIFADGCKGMTSPF